MVEGVTNGYSKKLEIVGVGYRCQMQGKDILLNIGFSHPVVIKAVDGLTFETPDQNTIIVSGADKQLVGQTSAEIRSIRKPEPYHGKGIKYSDEHIRRKAGKAGK
jgi:large subunit ribosomal protein L6